MNIENNLELTMNELYQKSEYDFYYTGIFLKKEHKRKKIKLNKNIPPIYFDLENKNSDLLFLYIEDDKNTKKYYKVKKEMKFLEFIEEVLNNNMKTFNNEIELEYRCDIKIDITKVEVQDKEPPNNIFNCYRVEFYNIKENALYFSYFFNHFNIFLFSLMFNNEYNYINSNTDINYNMLVSEDRYCYCEGGNKLNIQLNSNLTLSYNIKNCLLDNLKIFNKNITFFQHSFYDKNITFIQEIYVDKNMYITICELIKKCFLNKIVVFNKINDNKKIGVSFKKNNISFMIIDDDCYIEGFSISQKYSLLMFVACEYIKNILSKK